jgi:hypothetical protein
MESLKAGDTNIADGAVPPQRERPAYDPNNLSPADEEARKYDDTSEGIDWRPARLCVR